MSEILKTTIGFIGIILVSLIGVAVSEFLRLGSTNAIITTIDNVAHVR